MYYGYNWEEPRLAFAGEISFLEAAIARVENLPHPQIEVRVYHQSAASRPTPVYLPLYNEVEPCDPSPFQKITYELSEEERKTYDEYVQLNKDVESTNDVVSAMMSALRTDFRTIEPEFRGLIDSLNLWVTLIKIDLDALAGWRDQAQVTAWLSSVATSLTSHQELKASIDTVAKVVKETRADLDALIQLSTLKGRIAGQDAEAAMSIILGELKLLQQPLRALNPEVWNSRLDRIRKALAEVTRLGDQIPPALTAAPSPVADLQKLQATLDQTPGHLATVTERVRSVLSRVLHVGFFKSFADRPLPRGQRRLDIHKNLDTEFDLQSLCEARRPGDRISVEYHFYMGDEDLSCGWRDQFEIRVLGFHNSYVASTGFVRRDVSRTWKPTAMVNWILKYHSWPGRRSIWDYFPGSLVNNGVFSGIGVSTMLLDFTEENDIETGVAITQSFFGDVFLAGYGWNLQMDDHKGFWFLSLRVFSSSSEKKAGYPPGR